MTPSGTSDSESRRWKLEGGIRKHTAMGDRVDTLVDGPALLVREYIEVMPVAEHEEAMRWAAEQMAADDPQILELKRVYVAQEAALERLREAAQAFVDAALDPFEAGEREFERLCVALNNTEEAR